MYLLCSDWSIRSLEKEKEKEEKEKEEENFHMLITARCTNEGRDKNAELFRVYLKIEIWFDVLKLLLKQTDPAKMLLAKT